MSLYFNIAFFWDVTPCSLVDQYRRFEGNSMFRFEGSRFVRIATSCVTIVLTLSKLMAVLKLAGVAETLEVLGSNVGRDTGYRDSAPPRQMPK
jgi:hypothetical protein